MGAHGSGALDTVVFDLGNVLVDWDPYLPHAEVMSRAQWSQLAEDSGFFELNAMADRGVPLEEVIAAAQTHDPRHGEFIKRYYDRFDDSLLGPVPGTAEIVEDLLQQRVRLLGLTNWCAETFHYAPANAPAINMLEAVTVSGHEKVIKPEPEIFHRLCQAHQVVPERAVFIDDTSRNSEAATELGFTGLHFTSAEKLRDDLKALGLLN